MYETKARAISYSPRVGKKTEEVKVGCLVIEHVPTGKFIAIASKSVSDDATKLLMDSGRQMNALRKFDDDLRVLEYPTKTVKQAQAVLKEIQDSVEPKYLFLGDNSKEKKRCRAKAKSKPKP